MKTNPLFTPKSGRIRLSLLTVAALLMALIMPAFVVVGTQRAVAEDTGNPSETGTISVFKTLVDEIGQQDTPMGRDTSLAGFTIDFLVFEGDDNTGEPVQTITVTLGENAGGGGNVGNGSEGRATSTALPVGTFTVCEVEVATGPDGEEVLLNAEPRPEAGNGGSTGGQQEQFGENCITVEITAGNAELQFLDEQVEEVPTEKPTEIPDNQQEEPTEQPKGEEPTEMPDNQQEGEKPDTGAGETPDNQQEGHEDTDTDTGAGETPDNQQGETPEAMPETGAGGVAGAFPVASLGYLGGLLTLVGGSLMVRRKR